MQIKIMIIEIKKYPFKKTIKSLEKSNKQQGKEKLQTFSKRKIIIVTIEIKIHKSAATICKENAILAKIVLIYTQISRNNNLIISNKIITSFKDNLNSNNKVLDKVKTWERVKITTRTRICKKIIKNKKRKKPGKNTLKINIIMIQQSMQETMEDV